MQRAKTLWKKKRTWEDLLFKSSHEAVVAMTVWKRIRRGCHRSMAEKRVHGNRPCTYDPLANGKGSAADQWGKGWFNRLTDSQTKIGKN